ncbi:MAG: non-ribosomal peptide synthetase module [Candidatus Pristimantibacillus lignocellulolyticus]|uniref:Non-ribosomal peptide synthetase module n=1 Tax=Candidatus Pristimantibacillus lignocellulolyticus TaxID=2994561 RepID=A0A9J6Z9K7_9BACL|nr:MAG: non-ribosomal peptide synthetase module [Candidatus Pristimantibacillus lignocellulolyticus]
MAKRIATEYVNARFELSSSELASFIVFMEEQQLRLQVLILENGNQSLLLEDVAGHESIRMTFESQYDEYVCELSCRIVQLKLTNAMRKAVSAFRGNAIVNRIYSHYTMVYQYKNGGVHRIIEKNDHGERTVFEKKNIVQKIQRVFDSCLIEREIKLVHQTIDEWLDLRNQASNDLELDKIDEHLKALKFKLFTLEAN